ARRARPAPRGRRRAPALECGERPRERVGTLGPEEARAGERVDRVQLGLDLLLEGQAHRAGSYPGTADGARWGVPFYVSRPWLWLGVVFSRRLPACSRSPS